MKAKRVIFSLLLMLSSLTGGAYSFMVDSICYKILSNTDTEKTVAVTANDGRYNSFRYSGDIVIPSTVTFAGTTYNVTEIAWYAFYLCSDLTSVIIPNTIKSIGGYAFQLCSKLTSITLPNSIDKIERYTFYDSGLTSIQIPENVESIGDYAFYDCNNLQTISLGNVTSIGDYAFSGQYNYLGPVGHYTELKTVEIPSSVKSIGNYAFANQYNIQTLTLHEGLKDVGQSAFRECRYLTSVSIPSSVEHIGNAVFYNCSSLSTVTASTFAPKYMGSNIFYGTSWYNNQTDGIIYLGNALFKYKGTMPENTELSIPAGTSCIAGVAFSSQRGLKSVSIPSSVEGIGSSAFSNCTALETINIPDGINCVGNRAFYNTAWFNNHPDGLIYVGNVVYRYKGDMAENTVLELRNGTTAIVDTAFYNCTNLTSVTIPNSVKELGTQVFSGCLSLSDVSLPGISLISEKTFENCTSLQTISLPEGVNEIGAYAFSGCTSLTNVVWPSTIKEIKDYAFSHCSSLSSMVLPEGLCSFGSYVFEYCTGLTSITFPSTLGGGFRGGATSQGNPNIKEARFLSSRAVPRSVSNVIGGQNTEGFDIYKFIYYVPRGLREEYELQMSWNDRILEMGEDENIIEFADPEVQRICIANYDANLSGTVDETELGEVHYPMIASMGYFYKQNFRGNTTITSFDEFQYFTNCTDVPSEFFSGCNNLTSITLPITVTNISNNAFRNCPLTSLKVLNPIPATCVSYSNSTSTSNPFSNQDNCKLYVPEGSKAAYQEAEYWKDFSVIIEVVDGASQELQELIELSSTLQIELNHAVEGTKKGQYPIGSKAVFQSVIDDVNSMINKSISQAEITLLTERLITAKNDFESKVYLIGVGDSFLFQPEGSSSTLALSIVSRDPDIVCVTARKYHDGSSWASYYSGDIVIPETVIWDGVEYSVCGISSEAFRYSTITSISIPNSVTSIGNWAFYNCSGLTSVKVDIASPLSISSSTFSNRANTTLIVPAGCKADYEGADYWKEFKEIIEFVDGDVNGDGESDVVDVVDIARYVVGTPAETFVQILADINSDGNVNIGDAVTLVNDIAGDQNFAKPMMAPRKAETSEDVLTLTEGENGLSLALENQRDYTAFQFDLYVPEDVDVMQMMLNKQRKQKHQLLYNKVEDGHWRVAALSTSNRTFEGNNGELLSFTLDGISNEGITLSNILFFDAEGNSYHFDDITLNGTTMIQSMDNGQCTMDNSSTVYDLQGRKMVNGNLSNRQLPRGVYIVNGKKVVIK